MIPAFESREALTISFVAFGNRQRRKFLTINGGEILSMEWGGTYVWLRKRYEAILKTITARIFTISDAGSNKVEYTPLYKMVGDDVGCFQAVGLLLGKEGHGVKPEWHGNFVGDGDAPMTAGELAYVQCRLLATSRYFTLVPHERERVSEEMQLYIARTVLPF
ncbi:hypothetical protein [Bradyrhizobium sp. DOA1]|uniref:hypothetical protein n=1 Tax=Bradyrhizobium sp. DOA1 TaxID=1126616 RepID=UPI00077CD91C|nr:hypothetical protein [Bradyrhizobium sp. DOA1]KYH02137.1 hypothetical protein SE91_30090 [Bradyrhizobium sp. DOA1]